MKIQESSHDCFDCFCDLYKFSARYQWQIYEFYEVITYWTVGLIGVGLCCPLMFCFAQNKCESHTIKFGSS